MRRFAALMSHARDEALRSRLPARFACLASRGASVRKKHLPRTMTHFRFGVTNAIAEGINNKVQTIGKQTYGF